MTKISLKERRFLIIWFCINAFALFVNIANLEGRIDKGSMDLFYTTKYEQHMRSNVICILTDRYSSKRNVGLTFYPFNNNFSKISYSYKDDENKEVYVTESGFLGIFNGYGYFDFCVYILIGFVLVFLPKIWRNPAPTK